MKNKTLLAILISSGASLVIGGITGFILGRKTSKKISKTHSIDGIDFSGLDEELDKIFESDDMYNIDDIWEEDLSEK